MQERQELYCRAAACNRRVFFNAARYPVDIAPRPGTMRSA
jgi:hypothetical protein